MGRKREDYISGKSAESGGLGFDGTQVEEAGVQNSSLGYLVVPEHSESLRVQSADRDWKDAVGEEVQVVPGSVCDGFAVGQLGCERPDLLLSCAGNKG